MPTTVHVNRTAQTITEWLPVSTTFIKFLIVGGVGYLVNQVVLFSLYDSPVSSFLPEKGTPFDVGPLTISDVKLLIASILAVEASIASNFFWHERWTFRDRDQRRSPPLRYLTFHFTSMGSPLISLTVVNVLSPVFGVWPYISNTVGICLAAVWNWTWNTRVIWPRKPSSEIAP